MKPNNLRTQFRRHECKYLIPESLAAQISTYISPYVEPDPYTASSPDHSYDITSLYLDSPDLRLFQETEDGLLNRIKLRIRSYDDDAASPVFLEIKRRFNSLVLKGRARIDRETMASLLDGGTHRTMALRGDQKACYEEFVGWMARWLAEPKVWVRYRREAYMGIFNEDVRITMDRNLVCAPSADGSLPAQQSSWLPVETRQVVLEVKFDESFPAWVARLIQHHQLSRRSYSKYGNSVKRGLIEQPATQPLSRAMSS